MKASEKYECVHSASVAYTKGKVYEVTENYAGKPVLTGDDGIEDLTENLISKFKLYEEKPLLLEYKGKI